MLPPWARPDHVLRRCVLVASLLQYAVSFEAVPCNATTRDCGLDFFRDAYHNFLTAEEEIFIMPFFIKPELKLFSTVEGAPADVTLTELIVQAIKRRVHVWILGWDNAASEKFLPFHQDTVYERIFEAAGEHSEYLHLMLDTSRDFVASLYYLPHIKSYVFDRKVAFVGGLDFAENRLDTPQHIRPDPRLVRVPRDKDHVTGNEKPWQDAMVRIDGAAAEHVAVVLIERWWTYCKSEGYLRSQATRPFDAIADAFWGVEKSLKASKWKNYQCSALPTPARLGVLRVTVVAGSSTNGRQYKLQISTPKIQSEGLEQAIADPIEIRSGEERTVTVHGLRALDRDIPNTLDFLISGQRFSASADRDTTDTLDGGDRLLARWLPNGVPPPAARSQEQTCKVVLSGDRDWMGVASPMTNSYDEHMSMIREAKRFIFIENQYFSTEFPAQSHECSHGNVRGAAVLYSGATNRVGEVLLDRIKRAGRTGEKFSVVVVIPLGTEPGSFYPNLRGTYCFEQAVEDYWKTSGLKSNWRDYFSFFFIANAVPVPENMGGPGAAFYGIFTHTKLIVVDDAAALIGSANINDRSLNGDRDAEVGVRVDGGSYPRRLRETILGHHVGDASLLDPDNLLASVSAVAFANAKALRESMGISFPDGTYTKPDGQKEHFFGLKGLMNLPAAIPSEDEFSTLPYPNSRVVAGGGGMDTFEWFVVKRAQAPRLRGLLFPFSRDIWGLPKMTQVTQMFSSEFNWRRLDERGAHLNASASEAPPLMV